MADVTAFIKQKDVQEVSDFAAQLIIDNLKNKDKFVSETTSLYSSVKADEIPQPAKEPETQEQYLDENKKIIDLYKRTHPSPTATESDVKNSFGDTGAATAKTVKTEEFNKAAEQAAKSETTDWSEEPVTSTPGKATINGKPFKYSLITEKVDWEQYLDTSPNANIVDNIDILVALFTQAIENKFGGFGRIQSIVVLGGQFIVNGVMYVPRIPQSLATKLPLDAIDYFKNGCLAQFFDWGMLRKMKSLYSLSIDDVRFYNTTVADGLNIGYNIGISTIFNVIRSLQEFTLGRDTITRDSLNTPKSKVIKERLARDRQHTAFLDGFKIDVYAGTTGFADYACTNLKNYATSRGKKGILRFTGGVLARTTIFAAAKGIDAIFHTAGWALKSLWGFVKAGVTPVSEEDVVKTS